MKHSAEFPVQNFKELKIKMLNWANRFSIFCMLDNNQYQFEKPAFECLVGAGCKRRISINAGAAFESLKSFCNEKNNWLFGHFGYDLKNEIEHLQSSHSDGIGFDDLHFFEPEIVLQLSVDRVIIHSDTDVESIFISIQNSSAFINSPVLPGIEIKHRIGKERYIDAVEKLRAHIVRGDCYEINFCQEFYAENVYLQPLAVYSTLISVSPNPFSAFYKVYNRYCICASPERYLQKKGPKIISQPIKGTSKRNLTEASLDDASKKWLSESEKERSENTMVVDLVRNDLSKICQQGSVQVSELHGVYSFPQVHQMISTIEGEVSDWVHWIDIIKATFPMGSMTGAPKKRVMELIEQYEQTKRGLFSGAIGYVQPGGDFDFNVVIRSIFYNGDDYYLSFQAGSAITFNSKAWEEYEECLVKVEAIKQIVSSNII